MQSTCATVTCVSCARLNLALRQQGALGLCRYVGYALTTKWPGVDASKMEIIGFDMGGTSTDVSRYAGSYEHVFESTTAGELGGPAAAFRTIGKCICRTRGWLKMLSQAVAL